MHRFKDKEVYIVGGAVRDELLGKTPKDIDLVARVPYQELIDMGAKFIDPTSSFPVFSMDVEPYGRVEIALPRTESKCGNGHKGFDVQFSHEISIEEDLSRRDFTINAMAKNLTTGEIIDPFNGMRDLVHMNLRHTSPAFKDDPLRVFRALRFACKGFIIARETQEIMREMEDELYTLPMERIYNEMMKAMGEEYPEKFFIEMVGIGVAKKIFAPIHKMKDIPAGPTAYHGDMSVLDHSIDTLSDVSLRTKDPSIRLASFLHDYGKIFTDPELLPKHHNHEDREKELRDFLDYLKVDIRTRKVCCKVLESHMKASKIEDIRLGKRINFIMELIKSGTLDAVRIVSEVDSNLYLGFEFDKVKRVCLMKAEELGINVDEMLKDPRADGKYISQRFLQARVSAYGNL